MDLSREETIKRNKLKEHLAEVLMVAHLGKQLHMKQRYVLLLFVHHKQIFE